jgi:glycosyltransferase involved in cell wall biosynthesis
VKTVLFVAFHFPPMAGSSGQLRALKLCRYLPKFGWTPVVLSANPRAYAQLDLSSPNSIPPDLLVIRAFALDTQKHLAPWGCYPRAFALPDRWVTWCLGAIPSGLRAIRRHKADVILSTFPIATSVLIGLILHRLTGLLWVADFRDSMTEENYPNDWLTRRVYRWIEAQAVRHASRLVFTAKSTIQMYLQRYPGLSPDRCLLVSNGFDEEDFQNLAPMAAQQRTAVHPVRLLHMGVLYPKERDPRAFFHAIGRLKAEGKICAESVQIHLRGSGSEDVHQASIQAAGIEDVVHLLPPLPYKDALNEGSQADGLLVFQGASCNHQIPAKVYEYLRLGRPILGLTSAAGDTAAVLREAGGSTIVDLADEDAIYKALPDFLDMVRKAKHPLPEPSKVLQYSRQSQARQVADCFETVVRKKHAAQRERKGEAALQSSKFAELPTTEKVKTR